MMADDVVQVDYSGTSDSDSEPASESDKVDPLNWQAPSSSGIVHFAHGPSVLHWHAGCGCAPSPEKNLLGFQKRGGEDW